MKEINIENVKVEIPDDETNVIVVAGSKGFCAEGKVFLHGNGIHLKPMCFAALHNIFKSSHVRGYTQAAELAAGLYGVLDTKDALDPDIRIEIYYKDKKLENKSVDEMLSEMLDKALDGFLKHAAEKFKEGRASDAKKD